MPKSFFRDFTLAEISHLSENEFQRATLEQAKKIVQERLKAGKQIIDNETKQGELILIEDPRKYTAADFIDPSELQNLPKSKRKKIELIKSIMNFYSELANYARKKGRIVQSIESGVFDPKGRVEKMNMQINTLSKEASERLHYLTITKRNKSMQKRIETKKPKLAIVADGHALVLAQRMKPKKIIYTKPDLKKPIKRFIRKRQSLFTDWILGKMEKSRKAHRNALRKRA